ncbi:MAG TPA: AMP-binding protein, partial [Rubrivivax sp.]|nr:AMP-binding protein [Rubrivivax sp.]
MTQRHEAVDHHAQLHRSFRWQVPADFNIGQVCCTRWARDRDAAQRVAIAWENEEEGTAGSITYAELQAQADRLSHALVRLGVGKGDRVAIVMPQRPQTAVAHIALYQIGAVAMPLSMLFGPEALEYRLQDSGAVVAVCDESSFANMAAVRASCPQLRTLLAAGRAQGQGDLDWDEALAGEGGPFAGPGTNAEDPAVLIYTSGTTGPPKGALLPHRALIGNLSGFVCSQNWFPDDALGVEPIAACNAVPPKRRAPPAQRIEGTPCVFWSPADWAWTGGLMDALLPTLYFGRRIVAFQGRFSPQRAFELMQRHGVTHTFLFPTALKAMMKAVPAPREQYALQLRAVMSAGEAVGDAVFHWCRHVLGVTVNEMFGQTEMNYIVGNCGSFIASDGLRHPGWPARPGSMGRPYPGHRVAVIDNDGRECPRGTPGDVALHRRD